MTDRLSVVLSHVFAWPEVTRGAERYVHELGAALLARGHEVRILTTSPTRRSDRVLGVPVRGFPRSQTRPRLSTRGQVRFSARCFADVLPSRVDVWHAGGAFDGAAAAVAGAVRPGLRSVLTLHGPVEGPVLEPGALRRAFGLASRVDRLVCVSQAAARQLEEASGRQAHVVPPGVDATSFSPGGRRADHPVLLYVGTLDSARKNVGLLLEAAALVPGLEVRLAGPGDPQRWLASAPAELRSRTTALGVLEGSALVEAYRAAWVTALVSEREVFGMTVVESLACGTPVLVLDDGWGPSERVRDGIGVRAPADPEGMAAAIRRALDLNHEPETVERCRAVGEEYDWTTRVVPQLEEVYTRG